MKNILCYGDSNTFGFTLHGGRHPYDVRWTGRLQLALGPAYRVIEEGCGGRTTVFEIPSIWAAMAAPVCRCALPATTRWIWSS